MASAPPQTKCATIIKRLRSFGCSVAGSNRFTVGIQPEYLPVQIGRPICAAHAGCCAGDDDDLWMVRLMDSCCAVLSAYRCGVGAAAGVST